jgi:hypothetical protein
MATPTPGAGSVAATLHLLPPPPPLHELPLPLQPPPQPDELEPPLHPDELEPLLQPPPPPPLPLLQPPPPPPLPLLQLPPDELESLLQPPPPPPLLLDEQALQVPPQPLWSFEREQALSQDSELLQLGPEQSQLGEALQRMLGLLLHELLQLTEVERGGAAGGLPPSSPGNGPSGGPKILARQPSSAPPQVGSVRKPALLASVASESAACGSRTQLGAASPVQRSIEVIASARLMHSRK